MNALGFLHAGFLLALPVALAPLLILFLFRKPFPVRPFGSLYLLRSFVEKKMRRWRRNTWLLTVLRCLLLLVLVLLFADPFLATGNQWFGESAVAQLLIIDDSYSMQCPDPGKTPFDHAGQLARELLGALPASAECAVLYPNQSNSLTKRGVPHWKEQVSLSHPTMRGGGLRKCRQLADAWTEGCKSERTEVYLFSDFQKWEASALLDTLVRFEKASQRWTLIPLPTRPAGAGLIVDSMGISRKADWDWENLDLHLYGHSGEERGSARVSLFLNEEKVWRSQGMHLPERWRMRVPLTLRSRSENRVKCLVEGSGGCAVGAARYGVIHPPGPKTVAVWTLDDEVFAGLSRAIRVEQDGTRGRGLRDVIRQPSLDELPEGADVYWLSGLESPGPVLTDLLQRCMQKGRRVVVSLSPSCDVSRLNRLLTGPMGLGQIRERISASHESAFHLSEYAPHPLFKGFRLSRKDEVAFRSYFRLVPAQQTTVLARLSNGDPLVVESRMGEGVILLVCASLMDGEVGNVAGTAFFVPFVQRAVAVSGLSIAMGRSFGVGEILRVPVKEGTRVGNPILVSGGMEEKAERFRRSKVWRRDQRELRIPPRQKPGHYRVEAGGTVFPSIPVNVDARELAGNHLTNADLHRMAEKAYVRVVPAGPEFMKRLTETGRGTDLSSLLLAVAALLLMGEMLLTIKTAE